MTLSTALGFEPRSFDCRSTALLRFTNNAFLAKISFLQKTVCLFTNIFELYGKLYNKIAEEETMYGALGFEIFITYSLLYY